MGVFPDFGGVGASGDLARVVGALLMFVLVIAVLMLIVSAITWGLASANGNYNTASKAKTGVFVALGAAVFAGAAVTLTNWLIHLGSTL
jgi:steroid 5-alpha reductase family enzyme